MSFTVLFHHYAREEYNKAFDWHEKQSKGLGKRFMNAVEEKINLLSENPELYQIKYNALRSCKLRKFPYLIIYKIYTKLKTVFIVAIHHTSRKLDGIL